MEQLTVRVLGTRGLALELFRQLLVSEGVAIADEDEEGAEADDADPRRITATVTVLVEPDGSHWATAKAEGLPIVMVVSDEAIDGEVVAAVMGGAEAVLHGNSPPADVVAVLEQVGRGGTVLEPGQARTVADLARAAAQPAVQLSKREAEILASILRGDAVKQTARHLGISPKTVENIQSRLFRKLDVRNRAQAVSRAHELGLH